MCLAIPGRLENIYEGEHVRMGKVSFGGIVRDVCLEHVPEAGLGDYVLVHVGFALQRINEAEAEQIFAFLESMGELAEELGEATGTEENPG